VGHGEQLGRQGVQVDPLAQAGAEGGDRPGGVVAVPVEAAVDRGLDAAAGRLEAGREAHRLHSRSGLDPLNSTVTAVPAWAGWRGGG
jgi:hypothetical protein